MVKGERLFLWYFEKYDDYVKAFNAPWFLDGTECRWSKITPPLPRSNKKHLPFSSQQPKSLLKQIERRTYQQQY
ncbi:hypothetical protein RclHR1_02990005 [Rhizophagus clarus]|uniref:Uncharacterized protein n=1 Tax=Rhizophagus clarus TaxID=94130 RepID=A0A2Z6RH75_9GLOM|nr:hypothetical protein RclHR1_02990005 [Rhizophagus clarus]GES88166.1 hypothetical protein RCL_e13334_RclHR1_02990005 [Rhizophagus clarus]